MNDGSILEAVVWANCVAPERRHHLVGQILNHALAQHLEALVEPGSVTVTVSE